MKYLLLTIFVFGLSCAKGQTYSFRHFGTTDGLPSSEIYDITQDPKGHIWIATDHGVCEANGAGFRVYTKRDGLSDHTIFRILVDGQGRLYFTSFSGGIDVLTDGTIAPHPMNDTIKKILGQSWIYDLLIHPDEMFFTVNLKPGVYYQLTGNRIIPHIADSSAGSSPLAFNIHEEELLAAFLHYFDPEHFRVSKSNREIRVHAGFSNRTGSLHRVLRLKDGKLVLSTETGIHVFGDTGKPLGFFRTGLHRADALFEDGIGDLWVGLDNNGGVLIFRDANLDTAPEKVLPGVSASCIFQDKEGGIWIGTNHRGVYYLPDQKFQIMDQRLVMPDPDILCLFATVDVLYAGSYAGYFYAIDKEHRVSTITYGDRLSRITNLHKTNAGIFLLSNGFFGRPGAFQRSNTLSLAKAITEGSNDRVFVSMLDKVYTFAHGSLEPLVYNTPFQRIFALDQTGETLWIGTNEGLFTWSASKGLTDWSTLSPLLSERITAIELREDRTGVLSTKGNGLLFLQEKKIRQISRAEGLISDLILDHIRDRSGNIWAISKTGLSHVVLEDTAWGRVKHITNYTASDGLPTNEINDILAWNNRLYMATPEGIVHFNPRSLDAAQQPPVPEVAAIWINGKSSKPAALTDLQFAENNITLSCLSVSFRAFDQLLLQYRLRKSDPGNEQWVEVANHSRIGLNELRSGNYFFELRSRFMGNEQVSPAITIPIRIHPHFTETPAFRISAIAVILLLLMLGIRWYVLYLNKQNRSALSALRSRQTALKAQMNPHFIFNALNGIQYYIGKGETRNANDYIARLSRLVRKILDHSDKELLPLREEIKTLQNYLELEKLRFEEKLTFEINIDKNVNLRETFIPPMLLQPVIENAIWHGIMPKPSGGWVRVDIKWKPGEDALLCAIKDNGIGLEEAMQTQSKRVGHQSTGLKNIRSRLLDYSNYFKAPFSLDIHSGAENNGCEVLITIPQSLNPPADA